MKEVTGFLPGFHLFCGRAPKSQNQVLLEQKQRIRSAQVGQLPSLFADVVEPETLQHAKAARNRVFGPMRTFWTFLGQVLRQGSQRDALLEVQALRAQQKLEPLSNSTAAYSRARTRLQMAMLEEINERVIGKVDAYSWTDQRRILVVDGSSVQLPDTAKNQEAYPQPSIQKKGCGMPVVRVVGMFDLQSGLMRAVDVSSLHVNENALLRRGLMQILEKDDILLGDRGFCSYLNFWEALSRGADCVMRLQQTRKWPKGAKDDVILQWERPTQASRPAHVPEEQWNELPETLTVRYVRFWIHRPGFRSKVICLATTLLDVPAKELMELYLRRWEMELSLRDMKTTMGMELIHAKTPQMAQKVLMMHVIAYNLIRWLIIKAARQGGSDSRRISFKGTLDAMMRYAPVLLQQATRARAATIDRMLQTIASELVPWRPGRIEPRCLKRRPKCYQLMTRQRHEMIVSPSRKLK